MKQSVFVPEGSVFAEYHKKSWPFRFEGSLHIGCLMAGIPANPNVQESWLATRMLDNPKDDDALLKRAVAETMVELGITQDEAMKKVNDLRNLCAFKRDPQRGGELYIEGRQLKAALKEAVSVAVASGKLEQRGWGNTRKWITSYFPEHVFVKEERLYLGTTDASGVEQQFIHSRFGSSIQYNEYVLDAKVTFTIDTDHEFKPEEWAMIWTTGEKQGVGACRGQGYGTYVVTSWDPVEDQAPAKTAVKKRRSTS